MYSRCGCCNSLHLPKRIYKRSKNFGRAQRWFKGNKNLLHLSQTSVEAFQYKSYQLSTHHQNQPCWVSLICLSYVDLKSPYRPFRRCNIDFSTRPPGALIPSNVQSPSRSAAAVLRRVAAAVAPPIVSQPWTPKNQPSLSVLNQSRTQKQPSKIQPSTFPQKIPSFLQIQFGTSLDNNSCKVFALWVASASPTAASSFASGTSESKVGKEKSPTCSTHVWCVLWCLYVYYIQIFSYHVDCFQIFWWWIMDVFWSILIVRKLPSSSSK